MNGGDEMQDRRHQASMFVVCLAAAAFDLGGCGGKVAIDSAASGGTGSGGTVVVEGGTIPVTVVDSGSPADAIDAAPPKCPSAGDMTTMPKLRACVSDSDCVLHETQCCAYHNVVGLARTVTCQSPAGCSNNPNCPASPTYAYVTDDQGAGLQNDAIVKCINNQCQSVTLRCGDGICPDDRICVGDPYVSSHCTPLPAECGGNLDDRCAAIICDFNGFGPKALKRSWHTVMCDMP